MVQITIVNDNLVLSMNGFNKILSLRGELTVPLQHVRGVTADPGAIKMPKGLRAPGTAIPGLIYAGTFYHDGDKVFWNVHHAEKAIVIELADEEFKRLVVEVDNPAETVELIEKHLQ